MKNTEEIKLDSVKSNTVVFICNYAAEYAGNFIRCIMALGGQFQKCLIVLPRQARDKLWISRLNNFDLWYTDFRMGSLENVARSILEKYDRKTLIHTHFIAGLALIPFLKRFDHVICHYHMAVKQPLNKREKINYHIHRAIYSILLKKLVLIAVSQPVKEALSAVYPASRIICIPNAIDFARYTGKRSFQKKEGPLNLLIFGSFFYRKGVDLALKACSLLSKSGRSIKLTIVSENLVQCEKQASEVCGGEIPCWVNIVPATEDVESLYSAADVFLSPSRTEAFGYAVVEASYMGCLIVATDVPGQNSLINVPGTLWVNSGDVEGLYLAIANLTNEELYLSPNELGVRQGWLEDHYGADAWVDSILSFYQEIIV